MKPFTIPILTAALALSAWCGSRANAEAVDEPTRVTLRLRDVPVREAYISLMRQANTRFRYTWGAPSEQRRITLDLQDEPFWNTMLQISKASGQEIAWVQRTPTWDIALVPATHMRDRVAIGSAVDGVFYAALEDRTSDADRRAPLDMAKSVSTTLHLKLWAEPKLRVLYWHGIHIEELIDENGRAIEHGAIPRAMPFRDNQGFLVLQLAERAWPRRIGKLVIKSKVVTALRSDVAEISDLMADQQESLDAGGFQLQTQSRGLADGRELFVHLSPIGNQSPDWLRLPGSAYMLEPVTIDRTGRKLNTFVYHRDKFGRNLRLNIRVTPPPQDKRKAVPSAPPDKLYLDLPTEIANREVTLTFSDLNLH